MPMVRWTRAQPDGKVLVGGRFTAYRGVNRTGLARLNTNGSLDTTFNPGTGILGDPDLASVIALAIQADGQTVIGGPFYRYNGAVRHYLARVHGGAGSFPTGALRVSTSAAAGNTIPGDSTHGGDSIIYTIDCENDRPAPLARAKLSALVPAHTTPATASAGSKVTTVDGRKYVEWTLGTLAGQATGQRTFTVRVKNDAPLSSIVSGRATLSGRGASKSDSYPSLTVRNPLSVELTRESTAPVSPGDLVSYRLRVRNDASYALTAARAEQSVPQGTAFQSAFFLDASGQPTGSPIANPQGGFNPAFDARFNEVTWHLGPMAPAGEKLLRLTVRVQYDFAGSLTTGAPSVPGLKPFRQAMNRSGYAFYGQPAGSAAQLGVTGPALSFALSGQAPAARPILVLQKSFQAEGSRRDPVLGDVTSALPGGEMIVGVLAFNTGDATAERVSLRDFIPAGTAFVPGSLTVAGVPVTPGESGPYLLLTKYLLSLELGDLSAGEAVAVVYRVRIRESGENGARPVKALLLSNGYYLKTATERALTHGSPRDLHAQIVPPVTFGVEINGRQNEVMPGGALDYQIDVRNNGGVPASAVKISCRIPAGTAYESADLPAGATLTAPSAANKQTLTVHLGDLAPRDGAGDRESLGLHLRVSATLSAADVIRFNGIVATGATVTGSYLRGASARRAARQGRRHHARAPRSAGETFHRTQCAARSHRGRRVHLHDLLRQSGRRHRDRIAHRATSARQRQIRPRHRRRREGRRRHRPLESAAGAARPLRRSGLGDFPREARRHRDQRQLVRHPRRECRREIPRTRLDHGLFGQRLRLVVAARRLVP